MVQKVAFGSAKACLLEAERSCVGNKTAAFSLFRGFFQYFKLPLQHITDTMDIKDILKKLHVEKLNDMQNKAADAIMNTEKDVLILSATGSGKTLAYLLPLVQKADGRLDEIQAVVVVPNRELALQSYNVFSNMGCGLRAACLYGGRPAMDEHRMLRQTRPHIVFTTPGRANDHIEKGNFTTDNIRYFVIDEFDKCLEMGFVNEMSRLVNRLPSVRRRILLSATEADAFPRFLNMQQFVKIDNRTDDDGISERVDTHIVNSPAKDKLATLSALLRSLGEKSSIVFLNYRDAVERTGEYLRDEGFTVSIFHGGMEQKEREDALYKFSNGSANVLVCTDIASRGLDIPDVENIIHYHLPQTETAFVHRVGRTARWEAQGNTFLIKGPEETLPEFMKEEPAEYNLPEYLPQPAQPVMVTLYIGKGKRDKISKMDIVGFLCKKGGLKGNEIGRIDVKERYAYVAVRRQKAGAVLRKTQNEKIKGIKTLIELVK